jgi:hypothetical protein
LLKKRESRTRKKEKSKDSETSKKRLKTDKQKSMLLEPKELSRKVRELPERKKEKNSSTSRKY